MPTRQVRGFRNGIGSFGVRVDARLASVLSTRPIDCRYHKHYQAFLSRYRDSRIGVSVRYEKCGDIRFVLRPHFAAMDWSSFSPVSGVFMPTEFRLQELNCDQALEQRVLSFLRLQRIPGAYRMTPVAQNGVVRLGGRVSSFYHRQLCAHACCRVPGVRRVIDEIVVDSTGPMRLALDLA